jgi:tripeptidyl-peptidase I
VTCPFVTAVGATQIDDGLTIKDPEVATHDIFFSGGGFSDIYSKRMCYVNFSEF